MSSGISRTLVRSGLRTASAPICHACLVRRSMATISRSVALRPAVVPSGTSWSRTSRHALSPLAGYGGRSATTLASRSSSAGSGASAPPPLSGASAARIKVVPPSSEAIKEEGYIDDAQLLPADQANLIITPEAISQLEKITAREPPDVLEKGMLALRVGVESGGCHGYQYTMAITEDRGVDDYVFEFEGVKAIPVVVDLVSLGLLKGSTLHHATELIGSSFRIQDNPQAKEGGACGCGVSWELKPQ